MVLKRDQENQAQSKNMNPSSSSTSNLIDKAKGKNVNRIILEPGREKLIEISPTNNILAPWVTV